MNVKKVKKTYLLSSLEANFALHYFSISLTFFFFSTLKINLYIINYSLRVCSLVSLTAVYIQKITIIIKIQNISIVSKIFFVSLPVHLPLTPEKL